MIINPDKFQAIVVKKNRRMKDSYVLNINTQTTNTENCVKLLGIEIGNTLSFDRMLIPIKNKVINKYFSFHDIFEVEIARDVFKLSSSKATQDSDIPAKIEEHDFYIFAELLFYKINRSLETFPFFPRWKIQQYTKITSLHN